MQQAFVDGGAPIGNALNHIRSWEISNITSRTQGRHAMKFGARIRTSGQTDISPPNFNGTFTYAGSIIPQLDAGGNPILDANGRPVGTPITSIEQYQLTQQYLQQGLTVPQMRLLGGGPSQFTLSGGIPSAFVRQTDVGVFALDDWRVKPNLTLSYGLRYRRRPTSVI